MAKAKRIENANMTIAGTYPTEVRHGKDFSINTESPLFVESLEGAARALGVSPKGLFYLLQYGYTQSMQDSVAGLAKKLRETKSESGEPRYSDAEIAVALHDALTERHDAIVAGEVGTRATGPRVAGIDKVAHDYVWEIIVAAAAKVGKSAALPKKVADQKVLVEKYLSDETRREAAYKEAATRMATVQSADGVDLADLIGA